MNDQRALHFNVVIAGLDPAIHSLTVASTISATEWMPGSSPGMTTAVVFRGGRA